MSGELRVTSWGRKARRGEGGRILDFGVWIGAAGRGGAGVAVRRQRQSAVIRVRQVREMWLSRFAPPYGSVIRVRVAPLDETVCGRCDIERSNP